jgi:hypothetical protein
MTGGLNDPRAVDLSYLRREPVNTAASEDGDAGEVQVERWGSVWTIGVDGHVYRDGDRVDDKTDREMRGVLTAAAAAPPRREDPAPASRPVSRLPTADEIRQDRAARRDAARVASKTRKKKRRAQRQARKGTR